MKPHLSRRQFLGLSVAAAGAAAIAGPALLWEPYHPRIVRLELDFPHWPAALDGFRIAQLSDLHYDPIFGITPIEAAVRLTTEQSPDLVVITGDFVTLPLFENRRTRQRSAAQSEPCAELLKPLRSKHGVFGVLGNHDEFSSPTVVARNLQSQGIEILRNRALPIEHSGTRFFLAGVNDVLGGDADLDVAMRGISPSEPTILLAHEPDYADEAARYPISLQLSGHSHGGQIRVPYLWPLFLPPLARDYPKGLYRVGDLTLYTNVGIGTIHVPMRWNCPPEITMITLRCGGRRAS